jgi:uncharacterized protein YdhG (YjbR/CyaY superfamily)
MPEAEDGVACNLPGFMIGGSIVAGYAAFSKQCGLYVRPGAISEDADEIAAAGFKATRTGITFSPSKPIPDDLVDRLARSSRRHAGA